MTAESRSHGRSPWRDANDLTHEALLAALARKPVASLPDIEVGQEARTKDWYVKSLSVPMMEGEGWKPWLERMGEMARLALDVLPQPIPADPPAPAPPADEVTPRRARKAAS